MVASCLPSLFVLIVLQASLTGANAEEPSELVLFNGRVYTVDQANPWAEAVLVRGNEIAAVGTSEAVQAAAADGAEKIDLGGRMVLPGFIDTHVHLASAAQFHEFNLMRTSTQEEFVERVTGLVQKLPDGEWVTGGLWGAYDQWDSGSSGNSARAEPFAPDMARIEAVSDMSDDMQLNLYRDLRRQKKLNVRIDFRYTLDRWKEVSDMGIRVGSGDHWIRLGGLKGFIDGIMGTSAARFFEPYSHQPGNRGSWREMMKNEKGDVDPEHFYGFMRGADRAGLQITVHAIGDEANHLLLDFVERLEQDNGKRDRRFRLVHAQVVARRDFERIGRLGIIGEVQPFHLSDDMRWMEERIGADRCANAYAFRSILDSGARLCFGSDWPGTSAAEYPINPMLALYAAVSRQTINGTPPEGWFPDQRISLETAIRCHTLDAAYALYEEKYRGSIEKGKLADLVILSDNLFEITPDSMLAVRPVATFVDGKIVYRTKDF